MICALFVLKEFEPLNALSAFELTPVLCSFQVIRWTR